jgi:4-hydroxy-tetrahydrodipicolinate synthase
MVRAVLAGDLAEALRLHRELIPAVRGVMTKKSQGAIMAKAALMLVGVLSSRAMRSPLVEATEDQVTELQAGLVAAGLLT